MTYVIFWTIAAIVLAIVEGMTFGLTTIWFAAGALLTVIVAWLGVPLWGQLIFFFAVSIALLASTRPILTKYMTSHQVKTNVDSLVDKRGIVIKSIEEHVYGQVKLGGQIWTAKSYDDATILEGQEVIVVSIDGVKLVVKPLE